MSEAWVAAWNGTADGWTTALLRGAWQGGAAVLVVMALCRLLPRLSPAWQCRLWRLSYAKLLVAGAWAVPVTLAVANPPPPPVAALRVIETAPERPTTARAETASLGERVAEAVKAPAAATATETWTAVPGRLPTPLSPAGWARLLWSVGVTLGLARLVRLALQARRLRRECRPIGEESVTQACAELCRELGVRRAPELLLLPGTGSPLLLGGTKPAILLPAGLLESADLRLALAHEVAHLRRGDLLWGWLVAAAHVLFFFHPLLWPAGRAHRLAQEMACDELVVGRIGAAPGPYGQMLLDIARGSRRSLPGLAVVGIPEDRGTLTRRLSMLERYLSVPRTPVSRWQHAAVLAVLAVALVPWQGVAQVLPGGSAAEKPSILAEDPRLKAPVTLALRDRPLGEALPELGKKLGVPLKAAPDVQDDQVTFLGEEPAGSALAALAKHLDMIWARSGNGYELTQGLPAKQREATLRAAEVEGKLAGIRIRLETMARLAARSPAEREARLGQLNSELGRADLPRAAQATLSEEKSALEDLGRWGGTAAAAVWRTLTPAHLVALRTEGTLKLSTADGSLSSAAAGPVYEAPLEQYRIGEDRIAPQSREFVRELLSRTESQPRLRASVTVSLSQVRQLTIGPPMDRGGVQIRFHFQAERGTEDRPVPGGAQDWVLSVPVGGADVPTVSTDDPALLKAIDLELPKPGRDDPASLDLTKNQAELGGWRFTVSLGEVLEAIHRKTGLSFLSDSFIRTRVDPDEFRGSRRVVDVLNRVAKEFDYAWDKQGDRVLLRSRSYFRDRLEQVPERLVRPWRERVAAAGGLASPDDLGELAAALTDFQCQGMNDYWGWYLQNPTVLIPRPWMGFYAPRHSLRLWASLSKQQRTAALGGQLVSTSTLTAAQKELFRLAAGPTEYELADPNVDVRLIPPDHGGIGITVAKNYRIFFEGRDANGGSIRGQAESPAPQLKNGEKVPGYPQVVQVVSFEVAQPMAVYTFRYHDDRSILPIPGDPLGRKMYLDPKVPQRSTILEIAYPPQPRRSG